MTTHSSYERQYFYFLLLLSKGIGPAAVSEIRQALDFSGVSDEEFGHELTKGLVADRVLIKTKHRDAIIHAQNSGAYERFLISKEKSHVVICPGDDLLPLHYWEKARRFRLPTIFLAKGTNPPADVPWVAVIGSRNASAEGLERARKAGTDNALNGFVTVSGGARGADSAGTSAASGAGGWTVIVPAQEIGDGPIDDNQMLLSPYAPGTRFSPGLAMARNGVVIGLATNVIVADIQPANSGQPSGTEHAMSLADQFGIAIEEY